MIGHTRSVLSVDVDVLCFIERDVTMRSLSHEAGAEELEGDYKEEGDAYHLARKRWTSAVQLLVGVLAPSVVLRAGEDTRASAAHVRV